MTSLNGVIQRVQSRTIAPQSYLKCLSSLMQQRFMSVHRKHSPQKKQNFLTLFSQTRWYNHNPLCVCALTLRQISNSHFTLRSQSTSTTPNAFSNSGADVKTVFHNQPPSWLFVTNKTAGEFRALTKLDLELDQRLQGPALDELRKNIQARGINFDLDKLVADYTEMLSQEQQKLQAESQFNLVRQQIGESQSQDETESLRDTLKRMGPELKQTVNSFYDVEEVVYLNALKLPNDLHPSTPVEELVVLREKVGTREPQQTSHVEAGEEHGLIKFSNVGPTAYYLRGELAVAEWTISDLACDFIHKKGFRQISGPGFVKSPVVEGTGKDLFDTDEVLTLQHVIKDIVEPMNHLVGVSAAGFAGYLARLCVADNSLPFNLYSCGKTYQKSNLPGLFGATQSTQVGLCSGVRGSEVDTQFEVITELVWTLLQSLGFSLRLVQIPASKLGREERRRVELQVFSPSLNDFVAIGHVSDLGDFVSRRLMTCHNKHPNSYKNATKLHMISGTVVNVTSLLAAWVEHTDFSKSGL